MVKATAIIQARMSSSRLPGKVMMPLHDKPVIAHIICRLQQCTTIGNIILATSDSPDDDILQKTVLPLGISCVRGSLTDVLSRYYHAALGSNATNIIRVCADSPLVDKQVIDECVTFYSESSADIVKTIFTPLGLGTEIFSFNALEQAYKNATQPYQREHVTPYMYENLNVRELPFGSDCSSVRLTLDTEEDMEVIKKIYDRLYVGKHDFFIDKIINLLEAEPDILEINRDVRQMQIPLNIKLP